MMSLPIKMVLRWTLNIKYILMIKSINLSIWEKQPRLSCSDDG
jgi:hypothetical protein